MRMFARAKNHLVDYLQDKVDLNKFQRFPWQIDSTKLIECDSYDEIIEMIDHSLRICDKHSLFLTGNVYKFKHAFGTGDRTSKHLSEDPNYTPDMVSEWPPLAEVTPMLHAFCMRDQRLSVDHCGLIDVEEELIASVLEMINTGYSFDVIDNQICPIGPIKNYHNFILFAIDRQNSLRGSYIDAQDELETIFQNLIVPAPDERDDCPTQNWVYILRASRNARCCRDHGPIQGLYARQVASALTAPGSFLMIHAKLWEAYRSAIVAYS